MSTEELEERMEKEGLETKNDLTQLCNYHGDVATTSLIEVWMDETERRQWFLAETMAYRKRRGAGVNCQYA
jgi:DNA-binding ferritin-like protein